jgi:hypothetical protein
MPITSKTSVEDAIKDFEKSDAPQFKDKSKAKIAQMAIAATYKAKKNTMKNKNKLKEGELEVVYAVKKPYAGCELTDLVQLIDPLVGLEGHTIVPEDIHSVYSDQDMAVATAQELHADHQEGEQALEEKKGDVASKITKAIDTLEKKRKEHVDMAKEDPKNARDHKELIAGLATKIDRLMDQLAKVEKSKKLIDGNKDKKKK